MSAHSLVGYVSLEGHCFAAFPEQCGPLQPCLFWRGGKVEASVPVCPPPPFA